MREIKRLSVDAPRDAFERTRRGLLRSVELTEARFREIERAHSDHIVIEGEAVLIAQPGSHQIDLHYAYPDRDAFARLFPAMLERITAVTQQSRALGFRIRLRDAPSRPYVGPVLAEQDFAPVRDWWRMTLDGLPDAPLHDDVSPGFTLRPVTPDDADAIARIDEGAFSTPWLTPQQARGLVPGETLRVLEECGTERVVAYVRLRADFTGAGYISDVAVHGEYQRRGLGEAMMRWALAWFGANGYQRAALTVNADNSRAIALYRKLGFQVAEAGTDYRRPTDEDELRQLREHRTGSHIRVRRRY